MSDYIICPRCGAKLYGLEVHDRETCDRLRAKFYEIPNEIGFCPVRKHGSPFEKVLTALGGLCLLAVLTLASCATLGLTPIGKPTLAGIAKYTPPTAAVLAPACAVASPDADDSNACDVYHVNVWVCGQNLRAAGQTIDEVIAIVPDYGAAAAAVNGLILNPVISATQITICKDGGYIVPAVAPVVAAPAAKS